MGKKTYTELLVTLFEFLLLEWGNEGQMIFKDFGETKLLHDLGYECYRLNPSSFNGNQHTIGKKIYHGGLTGPEGMAVAYWTERPLSDSEPQLILRSEENRGRKSVLAIKKIQTDGYNSFDITSPAASQVFGIIDRVRRLLMNY